MSANVAAVHAAGNAEPDAQTSAMLTIQEVIARPVIAPLNAR